MLADIYEFVRANQFIITAPLALISIGTSVYLAKKNRAQHRITYETKKDLVFRSRNDLGPDLSITYKGEPVRELYQYSISIQNEGNQKYAASDFITPIKISLEGNSRIFSANLTPRCSRSNLLGISTNDDAATIAVDLMNPGDKIDISLLSDSPSEIVLHTDIAGVTSLVRKKNNTLRYAHLAGVMAVSIITSSIAITFAGRQAVPTILSNMVLTIGSTTLAISIMVLIFLIRDLVADGLSL